LFEYNASQHGHLCNKDFFLAEGHLENHMETKQLFCILAVIAFVALAQNVLFGQAVNFAQIQGRVVDASGAAVANAKVTATQTANGLVRTTSTNETGQYSLPSLPVGPYELRISAQIQWVRTEGNHPSSWRRTGHQCVTEGR
jgi:protocatechuate 3,4-dioxygenase beta subunit